MKYKIKNGYSFIEVIVAIAVFSVVVLTAVGVFSSSAGNYRRTRDSQRNLEAAQQAMNLMAKTIKTGVIGGSSGAEDNINLYDSSQGKCIKYAFNSTSKILEYYQKTGASISDCSGYSASSEMAGGIANLQFKKTLPVAGSVIGKTTIAMKICLTPADCSGQDIVQIQTTVSARDYEEIGI